MTNAEDGDGERMSSTSKTTTLPKWVPFAMFAGTTVALTIPLFIIRRQRRAAQSLASSSPPRTTTAFAAVNFARPNLLLNRHGQQQQPLHLSRPQVSSSDQVDPSTTSESSSEFSSPGPKELLSAISRVDYNTALFSGKAFGIATLIVVFTAFVVTSSVKTVMGIEDTRDFAHRARQAVRTYLPNLVSSIHKPGKADDISAPSSVNDQNERWNSEHSEKRLERAYEKGGMELWGRTALAEMEQELKSERQKRESTRNR